MVIYNLITGLRIKAISGNWSYLIGIFKSTITLPAIAMELQENYCVAIARKILQSGYIDVLAKFANRKIARTFRVFSFSTT